MSSGSTQNYQLSQWQQTDRILMSEFNQDNQKIDTALSALATKVNGKADTSALNAVTASLNSVAATIPKVVSGSYTGNGEAARSISLGFQPKAVLLTDCRGITYYDVGISYHYGGLALRGLPVYSMDLNTSGSKLTVLEITATGFSVYYQVGETSHLNVIAATNEDSRVYHYIAFV